MWQSMFLLCLLLISLFQRSQAEKQPNLQVMILISISPYSLSSSLYQYCHLSIWCQVSSFKIDDAKSHGNDQFSDDCKLWLNASYWIEPNSTVTITFAGKADIREAVRKTRNSHYVANLQSKTNSIRQFLSSTREVLPSHEVDFRCAHFCENGWKCSDIIMVCHNILLELEKNVLIRSHTLDNRHNVSIKIIHSLRNAKNGS